MVGGKGRIRISRRKGSAGDSDVTTIRSIKARHRGIQRGDKKSSQCEIK